MDSVVVALTMSLAVVISGYLVRLLPFSIPLPLVQIALGAVIAGVSSHGVTLEPEIFFVVFLPPLLFLDGWRVPNNQLLRDKATILELALGLVLFTMLGGGFLIHWLIPAVPLPVAFALAAIVSPTDPVAVSSITSRVPMPKRLMHILEGEALLNDVSGLVCFRFAVAAALTGSFSLVSASLTFLWVAAAGVAIGIALVLAVMYTHVWLSRKFGEESGSPILISLLMPFGAYLLADALQASGILAAVAAGITMSYVELSGRAVAATRLQRTAVWNAVHFVLNGVVFVLLGEQLPGILRGAIASIDESGHLNPWWLAVYALSISVGLLLLRFAWVWTSLSLSLFRARQRSTQAVLPRMRLVLAATLAGVRGAVTLAGIMTLPLLMHDGTPFPARDLAIFLASAVILLSLVMASVGLPKVLKGLELPYDQAGQQEEDRARRGAAIAAIAAVEHAQHVVRQHADAQICSQAATRVIAIYQRRLERTASSGKSPGNLREAEAAERELRVAGLQAEREEIFSLARQAQISDETARKLVHEIDLAEAHFRSR